MQMAIAQFASCVGKCKLCDWLFYVQRDWCDVLLWVSGWIKHPTLLIFNRASLERVQPKLKGDKKECSHASESESTNGQSTQPQYHSFYVFGKGFMGNQID